MATTTEIHKKHSCSRCFGVAGLQKNDLKRIASAVLNKRQVGKRCRVSPSIAAAAEKSSHHGASFNTAESLS